MKRKNFYLVSLFVVIIGIALSSCKSHEKCPAYSKANSNNSNIIRSV